MFKVFKNKNGRKICKLLTDTLMNVFNYISCKTKFDHKSPEWMIILIISALKKIDIYQKVCRNVSEYHKEILLNQTNEC